MGYATVPAAPAPSSGRPSGVHAGSRAGPASSGGSWGGRLGSKLGEDGEDSVPGFLGLGALWQSMPSGPTAWASLLFGLRASGIGKGVLILLPGLSELTFLRFVPSGWG
jgi:hypothetical protein